MFRFQHLRSFDFARHLVPSLGAGLVLAAVGCSTTPAPSAGDEQDIVPASKTSIFEQAQVCDGVLKNNQLGRESDAKDGSIRWKCGDVAGVTSDSDVGD